MATVARIPITNVYIYKSLPCADLERKLFGGGFKMSTGPNPSAIHINLDREKFELDRAKFEFDKGVQNEQIKLKQLETTRLAKELEFKEQDAARSRWTNPLVVAIIGAVFVGVGNIAVTAFNGRFQRNLSDSTNAQLGYLESVKVENASVLEVVKLGDPDKVRAGLCLLFKLNSIKTSSTNAAVQSYLRENHGCPSTDSEPKSQWVTAQLVIPGCGESGCNAQFQVCGSAPPNTKTTGNVRNYSDSFGNAWGQWIGAPAVTPTQVCQSFNQHSHNVTRTVGFQFEVVPTS